MKKISAILLALVMMLSMVAMAATLTVGTTNTDDDTNTTEETYTAYKILTADSTGTVYTIKSTDEWFSVLDSTEQTWLTLTPTADDITVYNATLKDGVANSDETAKALAAYLAQYTEDKNPITLNVGENTVADGYYLVTTSMGTALVLDTFQTTELQVKNTYPSVDKNADVTNATIGKTITYTITVTVPATVSEAITVTDTMGNGLTFIAFDSTNAYTGSQSGQVLTWTIPITAAGSTVTLKYTAYINTDNGEISGETNDNTVYIEYSEFTSTPVTETVVTYYTTFTKVDGEDRNQTLSGAEFKLYEDTNKNTEIKVVATATEGVYRVADTTETEYATITTPASGNVVIEGLGTGTYYLYETKAPTGYNLMTTATTITISDGNTATDFYIIENNKGSELPSTGGMGTTLFYVVGGLMMAAAVVLLVSKKKVNA